MHMFTGLHSWRLVESGVECRASLAKTGSAPAFHRANPVKKAHKSNRSHQFWQEGVHPELIQGDEKIEYIHDNPVRRGLVKSQTDYRWSSAPWYNGDRSRGPQLDPIE